MGQITVQQNGFSFTVNIAGDQPTPEEVAKIRAFTQSEQFAAFRESKLAEQESTQANASQPDAMTEAPAAPSTSVDVMGPDMLFPEQRQMSPTTSPQPAAPVAPQPDEINYQSLAQAAAPQGQAPKPQGPDVMSVGPTALRSPQLEETPSPAPPADAPVTQRSTPDLEGRPDADSDMAGLGNDNSDNLNNIDTSLPPSPEEIAASDILPDGPVNDLPRPNTSMFTRFNDSRYDWMSVDDKVAAVEEWMRLYRSHPKYDDGGILGSENYDGTRIPNVYVNPISGEVEIMDSVILEGVRDGLKFTAVLGGDIIDGARSLAGAEVTDENSVGNALDEYFTEYNETRLWQGLGKEASGMVGPGGAFAKLFGWMSRGLNAAHRGQAAARGLGITYGAIAGTDPNASGLFLGEEALFANATDYLQELDSTGILAGLDINPDNPEFGQRLQNRFNMLIEGGTLGLTAEAGIKFTALATKTAMSMGINTIMVALGAGQRTARQQRAVQEVTSALIAAEGALGTQAEREFLTNLSQAMRDNAEIIMEMDQDIIGTLQANPSTMNAYLVAVERGDLEAAANTILRARQLQQGGMQRFPEVARRGEATVRMAGQAVDNTYDNLGGNQAVRDAAERLQNEGTAAVSAAADDVSRLQDQLAIAETQLQTAARQNPIIGQVLDDISTRTGIRMTTERGQLVDNIATRIGEAYRSLKVQRANVYGQVQGGTLDTEGMFNELLRLEPAQLEAARLSLSSTGQLKALFDVIDQARTVTDTVTGPRGGTRQVTREATNEEMLSAFEDALEEAGITDYGTMFQNLRAPLAALKSNLFDQNSPASQGAAQSINDFIQYIDGDLLSSTGDSALVETVENAKRWDQENFIPYFRNEGPLRDIAQVYDNRVWSNTAEGNIREGADMATFMNTATNAFERNMVEENRHYAETILSLLQRPEGGGSKDDVAGYVLTKVLGPLSTDMKLNGGVASQGALQSAMDNLSVYATILNRDFPELAEDIRVLQDNLIEGRGNVATLTRELENAQAAFERVQSEVFNDRLRTFFTEAGLPVGNAQRAFDDMFTEFQGRDGGERFRAFTNDILASGDPVLIDGLRASYMNRFRREFFTSTETDSGTRVMSLAKLTREGDDASRWFEGLQMVWADRPEIAESYLDLLALAGNEQARATRTAMNVGSNTSIKLEQKAALNSIITMLMGPLSRRGARIRSAGSRFIDSRVNPQQYEEAMGAVLSDPNLFADMVDKILKEDYGVGREFMTNAYDTVIASFVQAGIFTPDHQAELQNIPYEQWETLRQTEAAANAEILRAREAADGLWDQMKSIFSGR